MYCELVSCQVACLSIAYFLGIMIQRSEWTLCAEYGRGITVLLWCRPHCLLSSTLLLYVCLPDWPTTRTTLCLMNDLWCVWSVLRHDNRASQRLSEVTLCWFYYFVSKILIDPRSTILLDFHKLSYLPAILLIHCDRG